MSVQVGYYIEYDGGRRTLYKLTGDISPRDVGGKIIEYIESGGEKRVEGMQRCMSIERKYFGHTSNMKYPINSYVYENCQGILSIYEWGRKIYEIGPNNYGLYKEYLAEEWDVRMVMCIDRVSGEMRYRRIPEICKLLEVGKLFYMADELCMEGYYIEKRYDKYDEVYTVRDRQEDKVQLQFIWVSELEKYTIQLPYGRREIPGVMYSGIRGFNKRLIKDEKKVREHKESIEGYKRLQRDGDSKGIQCVTDEIYEGYNEDYLDEVSLIKG